MKIIESILTNNPCYTAGKKITVKGLMLHSVGCNQPSAQVFINSWNKSTYKNACVHGFIDANTGDVYQTLPWNHRGWHCGSGSAGSGNNTHIGVEMCEPSTIKYTGGSSFTDMSPLKSKAAVLLTYNSAVDLFAVLCEQYGLDPMKNIISHREGHALGIATNHGDPEHLWSHYGLSMDGFRSDVKNKIGGDELVEKSKIIVDGKEFTVERILKDGTNYIKVRDLAEVLDLKVGFNGSIPVLESIK